MLKNAIGFTSQRIVSPFSSVKGFLFAQFFREEREGCFCVLKAGGEGK